VFVLCYNFATSTWRPAKYWLRRYAGFTRADLIQHKMLDSIYPQV
jgi:hypothetical protein